ncbi:hypothetical protein V8C44DRAFT_323702 [Trichoderma aethiopicum]
MADDDEGWTRVRPSKWANRLQSTNKAAANLANPGAKPTTVSPAVVAQLEKELQSIQGDLDAWFPQAELREIFSAYVAAFSEHGQGPVSQIVCFGIGCFDHPDGNWHAKRTSYCQLAALLLIAEQLATASNREPYQIIFQEPAFNLNDVAFIESLGHMVVDTPKGSDFIDCNTLFYGPHLYYQLYAEALQGQLPVIYVGSGIDSWELNTHLLPRNYPVTIAPLKKIFSHYQRFKFPEVKGGVVFHGTYICLRPPQAQLEAA